MEQDIEQPQDGIELIKSISHEAKLAIIREYLRERSSKGGKTTRERNPNQFKEMNRKSLEAKRLKKEQQTCKQTTEEV